MNRFQEYAELLKAQEQTPEPSKKPSINKNKTAEEASSGIPKDKDLV